MTEKLTPRGEHDVKMAARLYDCRSAARVILGENYAKTLQPWRDLIDRVKAAKQKTTLSAAIDIGLHIEPSDGMALMLIFAAGVEMVEDEERRCHD